MVEVIDERDIAAAKRYLTRVAQACGDTKDVKEVRPDHPAVEFARDVREAAAKADRDRLRELPEQIAHGVLHQILVWHRLRAGGSETIQKDDIRFIATAIADALESQL